MNADGVARTGVSRPFTGVSPADHQALLLAYAREREKTRQLEEAVRSNRVIGIAIGIVMASRLVTRDVAFELLRAASQHRNRKLRDLADDVILSGDLPGDLDG